MHTCAQVCTGVHKCAQPRIDRCAHLCTCVLVICGGWVGPKSENVEKPLVLPLFLQNRILDTKCVSKAVFEPTWGNLSTQKAPKGPPYGAPKMTNFEPPLKKGNVGNQRRPRHRLVVLLLGPWAPWGGVGEGKNKQ